MEFPNMGRKEADVHLIEVGRELEAEKQSNVQAFIRHRAEDGREFYRASPESDWEKLLSAEVESLRVNTLGGVADYLNANPDGLALENIIVHVRAEDAVDVISVPFGGWKQRETFMSARAVVPAHLFDRAVTPEGFVPYLQSCFCESEDLAALVKIAGNIVDTSEVMLLDDGVSQDVTIRSGAVRKAQVPVPSPAVLYPFCTFTEVPQPARKFVFRLGSQPLTCKLLEADGGAWKIEAINSVKSWLTEHLPEGIRIIA